MDSIKLSTEKALPSKHSSSSQLSKKEEDLPSSLDEMDSFIANAVNTSDRPSLTNREEKVFHSPKEESESNPFEQPIVRSLRGEGKPYNTIMACEIDEVTPQRGEVSLDLAIKKVDITYSRFCWLDIVVTFVKMRMDEMRLS